MVGSGQSDAWVLLGTSPTCVMDMKTCYQLQLLVFLPCSISLFPLSLVLQSLLYLPFQKSILCPGVRAPARPFRLSTMVVCVSFSSVLFLTWTLRCTHHLWDTLILLSHPRIPGCELDLLWLICCETFHSGWFSHSVKLLLPFGDLLPPLPPQGACVSSYVHCRFMARWKLQNWELI